MRLIKLVLRNYKIHEYLEVDIKPGITGIIGTNGAGKSSLISGLCFSITGVVMGDDLKQDLLREGATMGFTRMTFEASGKLYDLTRNLHTTKVVLSPHDTNEDNITGKENVDVIMEGFLNIDPSLLNKTVFIGQEELDKPFRETQTKRTDYYNSLFGAGATEKMREILQNYHSRVLDYQDQSSLVDDKKQEKTRLNDMVKKKTVEIANLQKILDNAPKESDLIIKTAVLSQTEKTAQQEKIENEIVQLKQDIEDCQLEVPQPVLPVSDVDKAKYRLRLQYDPELHALNQLDEQVKRMRDTFGPETRVEFKEKLKRINNDYMVHKLQIDMYETEECPVCKGDNTLGPEEFKITKAEYAKLEAEGKTLATQREERRDLLMLEKKADEVRAELESKQATVYKEVTDFSIVDYSKREKQYDDYVKEMQNHKNKETEIIRKKENVRLLTKQLEEVKLKECLTDKEKEGIDACLTSIRQANSLIAVTKMEVTAAESKLEAIKEELPRLEENESKRKRNLKARKVLDYARTSLHRERLPKYRTAKGIEQINNKLPTYMEIFNLPFVGSIDTESKDFVYSIDGARTYPFKRLSGGQRKMVAIALRLSMAELLASSFGLMVLDEPTAYIAEQNKHYMADAFKTAQQFFEERGTVIWVASHEEAIFKEFNRVIEL